MSLNKLKDNIYWVGVRDWDIRLLHDFFTADRGTSYNAYLVMDEKITLFDTVYPLFAEELLDNISQVIDPARINYVVVNHVEKDHSGALPEIMERAKPEKLFCSSMGKKALLSHYHKEQWPYEVVKTGDKISLGEKTVRFIEGRMLHWPDSMLSYLEEDQILISNDVFGQHIGTSERFDDEIEVFDVMINAAKYFANIFMPYAPLITKLLKEFESQGLDIDMIAPDHGLILRSLTSEMLKAYEGWAQGMTDHKALVIYDTMYHSTEAMARSIAHGLERENIKYKLMNLQFTQRSDILTDVLDSEALIFGSPTLNNGLLPRMDDMLRYLKGLRPKNKIGAAFGSYGWSGESLDIINKILEEMKLEVIDPGIKVEYVPTSDDLKRCSELGQKVGKAIKERIKKKT
jgi:flavorubredoxin